MSAYQQAVERLQQPAWQSALTQLNRGIEREALRIQADCTLAQNPHPHALGAALTHNWITTDFSESLLELITPVYSDPDQLLGHLSDVHRFVLEQLDQQRLWPISMPCFLNGEENVPIAQYGHSHIGRMKTTYRIGLSHRYGAKMQAIAGLHFNFSVPKGLWPALGVDAEDQAGISERYFGLLRHFRQHAWVLAYLFGASPALCRSFLGEQAPALPFEEHQGTLYLPYATSLRMSDLGYTNQAQDALSVSLNSMAEYVRDVKRAIRLPSDDYAAIGVKENGEYRQLNSNVLQIENELYAPIRPKRTAHSGETPTQALERGGVEYIEVRALDINPFSPNGIDRDQILLLDLFLLDGLLQQTPSMDARSVEENKANFEAVVLDGRRPGKQLQRDGQTVSLADWLGELFERFALLAPVLDQANGDDRYQQALAQWQPAVTDPEQTLSARALAQSLELGHGRWACDLAAKHKAWFAQQDYQVLNQQQLEQASSDSHQRQAEIEAADQGSFDQFLQAYFERQGA
ncbi:glutamate--cysteine ligase [Ferrimonas marina]|uniref:Glutamate--cysteine ligase n=1 Tax=Ferrimonas marina TaxID=299255 RepID=A0A1M5YIE1_9GAMM|nr:glutamate--cysteine ligase [Ferrimonas marina]SHI11639.1 glutamate-cysteine ligase [Ferrimonas marina]